MTDEYKTMGEEIADILKPEFTPYNGRLVLAEIAAQHGWSITSISRNDETGAEGVLYGGPNCSALIVWTPQNTAAWIGITELDEPMRQITGVGGLLTVRSLIEGN